MPRAFPYAVSPNYWSTESSLFPNAPRAIEIAVIIPDERSQDIAANPRDIIVRAQGDGRLQLWYYFYHGPHFPNMTFQYHGLTRFRSSTPRLTRCTSS